DRVQQGASHLRPFARRLRREHALFAGAAPSWYTARAARRVGQPQCIGVASRLFVWLGVRQLVGMAAMRLRQEGSDLACLFGRLALLSPRQGAECFAFEQHIAPFAARQVKRLGAGLAIAHRHCLVWYCIHAYLSSSIKDNWNYTLGPSPRPKGVCL